MSQKNVLTFGGLWIKKYVIDIQTEILIHQSKANLDLKILCVKITHLIDPEIRKYWERVLWEPAFHVRFWLMIYHGFGIRGSSY